MYYIMVKIYADEDGKPYINLLGKRIYINKGITKKELREFIAKYKKIHLGKKDKKKKNKKTKSAPPRKRQTTTKNKAVAIINQMMQPVPNASRLDQEAYVRGIWQKVADLESRQGYTPNIVNNYIQQDEQENLPRGPGIPLPPRIFPLPPPAESDNEGPPVRRGQPSRTKFLRGVSQQKRDAISKRPSELASSSSARRPSPPRPNPYHFPFKEEEPEEDPSFAEIIQRPLPPPLPTFPAPEQQQQQQQEPSLPILEQKPQQTKEKSTSPLKTTYTKADLDLMTIADLIDIINGYNEENPTKALDKSFWKNKKGHKANLLGWVKTYVPKYMKYFKYAKKFNDKYKGREAELLGSVIYNTATGEKQEGHGCACDGSGYDGKGLYDDEIEKVMKVYPDFLGVISRNEIRRLLPFVKKDSRIGFVLNTDPNTKPGQHWVAVYIDGRQNGSKSIEYYDSYADPIPNDIRHDLKSVVEKMDPNTLLKLKENKVVQQSVATNNCGFFAMRFLIDRFRGKSFSDATGYDEELKKHAVTKNEAEIERMKKLPPFSYI